MSDPRRVPPDLSEGLVTDAEDPVSDARKVARTAKWGALAGVPLGLAAGYLALGAPGLGIGLLVGIPGCALAAVLLRLALPNALTDRS